MGDKKGFLLSGFFSLLNKVVPSRSRVGKAKVKARLLQLNFVTGNDSSIIVQVKVNKVKNSTV